jgi:hypothetical protein
MLYTQLRIENTDINGFLSETNSKVTKNYTDIFPYFYMSYSKDEILCDVLYTISIYRPHFSLMNNYVSRVSDVLYDVGNPDLRPEKTHYSKISIDVGNHSFSCSYSHIPNLISELFTVENGITYHTNVNYGVQNIAGINYSFAGDIFPWWQINAYLSGEYVRIPESHNKKELYRSDISFANRITLKNIGILSLDLSGHTGNITGNSYFKGSFTSNFSFSRSFFDDNLNIQIGINNLFNTDKTRAKIIVPDLHYTFYTKNNTRCLWLSISYSFSTKKKINTRMLQNDNAIIDRL